MIQIYKASNTEFTSNGDFILDPVITKAELSVELNGTWELTLTAVIEDSGRALEIEQTDVIQSFLTAFCCRPDVHKEDVALAV